MFRAGGCWAWLIHRRSYGCFCELLCAKVSVPKISLFLSEILVSPRMTSPSWCVHSTLIAFGCGVPPPPPCFVLEPNGSIIINLIFLNFKLSPERCSFQLGYMKGKSIKIPQENVYITFDFGCFFTIKDGFSGIKIDFFKLFCALAFKFWNVTCRGHFWSISKPPIYISDAIRERGPWTERDYHLNKAFGLQNNVFLLDLKATLCE